MVEYDEGRQSLPELQRDVEEERAQVAAFAGRAETKEAAKALRKSEANLKEREASLVALEGRLAAVFPASRAWFRAEATRASFESLFGIALEPSEVMDLLVGVPSPRLREYQAGWGAELPRNIVATLPDGGRLKIDVDDVETGVDLAERAFEAPPVAGYREVDAGEARRLWSAR